MPCASYNLQATLPALGVWSRSVGESAKLILHSGTRHLVRLQVASDSGFCHDLGTALRSASMVVPIIALFFGLISIAIAIRANALLRQQDRVPMQWGINGEVNWTAPRLIGLSITPAITIGILILFCLAIRYPTHSSQENLRIPALLVSGAGLVAAQILHLWLIFKTLHRSRK